MKVSCFIAFLFFLGCQPKTSNNDNSTDPAFSLAINEDLIISKTDSLILETSGHKSIYPDFLDSSNSFCQLFGDTIKFYLSTGFYEGSYSLNIQVINDTFSTSLKLFDNYSKYIYSPTSAKITLNKKHFIVSDYVIVHIDYKALGKLPGIKGSGTDSILINGKIRLKVRDSNFTFEDFSIENRRNAFYSLLNQNPDTIKKLNLSGCAFKELPPELIYFKNLEELSLWGNDLSNANLNALTELPILKSLDLQDCKLSKLPSSVFHLKKLEILSLYGNLLTNIPDDLFTLTSLKDLTIGNNKFKYLSPKISNLKNLESFESSSTEIKSYPDEMAKLNKLVELYPNDTMNYIPKPLRKYVFGCDTILNK